MTKPQEILTPSLPQFIDDILNYAKLGYRISSYPQMLGWQYHCEMVLDNEPEAVVAVAETPKPVRGPKPKKSTEA